VAGVTALAALPAIVLGIVIWLSFQDGDIARPSLVGSAAGLALGPALYLALRVKKA
jgi:hypothetical protein